MAKPIKNEHALPACQCRDFLQKGVLIIKKASLTVEAALIFPIFFFVFIAFIYIIMWFQTAENVQQKLIDRARFISCAAYSADELITKNRK